MKNILIISSILLTLTTSAFAFNNGNGTHTVKSYTKSDGTYVEEHLSGNPNSGVHCKDNLCS